MKIDILTVVYRDELELLKKQAESFAYHLRFPHVNNIIVILNDDNLQTTDIDIGWWGWFKDYVRVLHRNELGYYQPPNLQGWYTQQVCKILGTCSVTESEWCFIFDAKTLLNKDYRTDLIFKDGRGRFANWPCNSPHWQSGLQFLKDKYDITDFKWISPAGVPFLAHVPTMRAMVYEEPDFVEWFHTYCQFPSKFNTQTRGITEFLCYSAYVSSIPNLFEDLYTGQQEIQVRNLADWEVDNFDSWMTEVEEIKPFTISIHPRAYNLLTFKQKNRWNDYIK